MTFRRSPASPQRLRSCGRLASLGLLTVTGLATALSWSQSAPDKVGAAGSAPTPAQAGSSERGFSIESEMLTYRALESNAEAVACDIAGYLNGVTVDFRDAPAGSACSVKGNPGRQASVLIAPFDRTVFDDFRFWRTEMETVRELLMAADRFCKEGVVASTEAKGAGGSKSTPGAGAAKAALDITPVGSALQMAQSLLGMLSTVPTNVAVAGTIEDQAFIDAVARELLSLNVHVLVPSTFEAYSLTWDPNRSPFLSSLAKLLVKRQCLAARETSREATVTEKKNPKKKADIDQPGIDQLTAEIAEIRQLIGEIDVYIGALHGGTVAAANPTASTQTKSPKGAAEKPVAPANSGTPSQTSPAPGTLMAILAGDGLAQKLGFDPVKTTLVANGAWHVLLLKALESGGSVDKAGNVFGSRVHYSGGSVGTYALFSLDGTLECSGNVYDYGGSISAKTFETDLHHYKPDPATQSIFHRGSCRETASQ